MKQVSHENGHGETLRLFFATIVASKGKNRSLQDQFTNFGEFGIKNRHESSVDTGILRRRQGRLQQILGEDTAESQEIHFGE